MAWVVVLVILMATAAGSRVGEVAGVVVILMAVAAGRVVVLAAIAGMWVLVVIVSQQAFFFLPVLLMEMVVVEVLSLEPLLLEDGVMSRSPTAAELPRLAFNSPNLSFNLSEGIASEGNEISTASTGFLER